MHNKKRTKKNKMKKYFLSILTLALFLIGFAASNSTSAPGTYEVTDKVGNTWRIIIKKDKTATVTNVKDDENVIYCKWRDLRSLSGGICVMFHNSYPPIVFEGGMLNGSFSLYDDGYLWDDDYGDSKHPKWKLRYKKIN